MRYLKALRAGWQNSEAGMTGICPPTAAFNLSVRSRHRAITVVDLHHIALLVQPFLEQEPRQAFGQLRLQGYSHRTGASSSSSPNHASGARYLRDHPVALTQR